MKNYILTIALLLATTFVIIGKTNFTLVKSSVKIEGTSNVHDWVSTAQTVRVTGKLNVQNNELLGINNLKVTIPVKGIKSTKGSIMDGKTWDALKYKKHPNIYYTLSKVNSIKKSGESYILSVSGKLSVAGVTKSITTKVVAKPLGGNQYQFVGSEDLKMTTYGIDPPTAMFGAMTTGDDIKIKFNITLKESSPSS
ncbi:MAG: YceI family protein [Bacteroidia bacterium]|nr:YceI family protein [Bacteroidia bacterium]NNJ56052.1 YceI family protein [Bacteroidia bacterium]